MDAIELKDILEVGPPAPLVYTLLLICKGVPHLPSVSRYLSAM